MYAAAEPCSTTSGLLFGPAPSATRPSPGRVKCFCIYVLWKSLSIICTAFRRWPLTLRNMPPNGCWVLLLSTSRSFGRTLSISVVSCGLHHIVNGWYVINKPQESTRNLCKSNRFGTVVSWKRLVYRRRKQSYVLSSGLGWDGPVWRGKQSGELYRSAYCFR